MLWQCRLSFEHCATIGLLPHLAGGEIVPYAGGAGVFIVLVGIEWDTQVEFSVQHSLILNAFRLLGRG